MIHSKRLPLALRRQPIKYTNRRTVHVRVHQDTACLAVDSAAVSRRTSVLERLVLRAVAEPYLVFGRVDADIRSLADMSVGIALDVMRNLTLAESGTLTCGAKFDDLSTDLGDWTYSHA